MKWGNKYSSDYVNTLHHMLKRQLTLPFTLSCFTDDASGISPEIQVFDLPALNIKESGKEKMWKKIGVFKKDLFGLTGNALFLDLDVVLVDNINCFFEGEEKFKIIKDYHAGKGITGNSSVFRFEIGQHGDLVDYLEKNFDTITKTFSNEQAFLSDFMYRKGILSYWNKSWCPSYKYDCVSRFPLAVWKKPQIPEGAKIVVFHGEINPPKAITGGRGKWYRYVRPAEWVGEYWK